MQGLFGRKMEFAKCGVNKRDHFWFVCWSKYYLHFFFTYFRCSFSVLFISQNADILHVFFCLVRLHHSSVCCTSLQQRFSSVHLSHTGCSGQHPSVLTHTNKPRQAGRRTRVSFKWNKCETCYLTHTLSKCRTVEMNVCLLSYWATSSTAPEFRLTFVTYSWSRSQANVCFLLRRASVTPPGSAWSISARLHKHTRCVY